jgi:chemotaxis protein methyltransferase CheR
MSQLFDDAELSQFRGAVVRQFGLQYDEGKLDLLADILRQRMHATGSSRVGSYIAAMTAPNATEHRALADLLTTNETFFFRNTESFRALGEHVLPERIRENACTRRLRILCAGCSSGEEPYSIAITLREILPEIERWDIQITAVDLSPAMLDKAAKARYSEWSLRATAPAIRRRHFRMEGRDFVLDRDVQRMVTFDERNLIDDDPRLWATAVYDVVFCRNVIMYFSTENARKTVARIAGALAPTGFLFLGHAEILRGLSQDFHLCHTHETFYYQRRTLTGSAADPFPPEIVEARVPALVIDSSTTWVEAIQRASERIAALTRADAVASTTAPVSRAGATTASELGLVLEAMRQERFADALTLLSELPVDAQCESAALLLRAVLLTNNGSIELAEEVCRRLLAQDELNAGARYVLALCSEHAGDLPAAIEHDQAAAYLDPGFAMPHLHLGLMARRSGDAAAIRAGFSQALALLVREDAARLLMFGGGFSRDALLALCRGELCQQGEP